MLWIHLQNWLARPLMPSRTRGAAFTEYAILIALVAVAMITALTFFSEELAGMFNSLASQVSATAG